MSPAKANNGKKLERRSFDICYTNGCLQRESFKTRFKTTTRIEARQENRRFRCQSYDEYIYSITEVTLNQLPIVVTDLGL